MDRSEFIQYLEAALAARKPDYARKAAEQYLADRPGDLAVRGVLARARAAEGDVAGGAQLLAHVTATDPQDWQAQRWLGDLLQMLGDRAGTSLAYASAHAGDGQAQRGRLPEWAAAARASYLAERAGDGATALREAESALRADPPAPLPALLVLACHWHAGRLDLARPLAEGFTARWPEAVAFKLCLAECLLSQGEQARAIALLHAAAANDAGGQVVARHWPASHPYRAVWEANVQANLPGPLPAEVVGVLGRNRLGGEATEAQGQPGEHSAAVDEIAEIQAMLDQVAARLPSRLTLKHRLAKVKAAGGAAAPAPQADHYILLSSRTRLAQVFGEAGFKGVDLAMGRVADAAARRTGLKARRLYVDDPESLSAFGLRPANPTNAWEVKTLLGKLSTRLKEQRGGIAALLIVGGPDIIPFHHLPNPTDDADADIPSDNPYATPDENYFVPEWPVGRLPTGVGDDPAPLMRLLAQVETGPVHGAAVAAGRSNWLDWLQRWLQTQWLRRTSKRSFGYSANVWRQAAAAVYNSIGDPRELVTSPPLDANALPPEGLAPARLSYFNLHGIEDGPEWYGQRSQEDPNSTPEYPIALRPADVVDSGRAPVVVLSEACYGANVFGKKIDEALCLKFLNSGTRILAASTKIAYGSVTTPLVGADLLGRHFWQFLLEGQPAGEAMRRAKLQMAHDMNQRQGFLDGEDQKTLISFVLYGDPLAAVESPGGSLGHAARPALAPHLAGGREPATVCAKGMGADGKTGSGLTPETVAEIKSAVARYLPDLRDADWRVAHALGDCAGAGHTCPTAQLARYGTHGKKVTVGAGTVVTLSKTVRANARLHPHFARLTLDEQGKVVKMAVSR